MVAPDTVGWLGVVTLGAVGNAKPGGNAEPGGVRVGAGAAGSVSGVDVQPAISVAMLAAKLSPSASDRVCR